ncbi:HlyD family efflux transporter periplasmic adaptor subunit [Actinoplanes sp. TBRC 11911]|nr:HlyD family efflux transporter periplasmic adaptor subunit [Actinoplanes sp. TBRC 11911]
MALAGVLVFSMTAASCGGKTSSVSMGQVGRGTVDEVVEAPGSVTARAAATVSAPSSGTLEELRVEAGQRVGKGQVLAVIDAPELEQRRDDAERALQQAGSTGVPAGGTSGFTTVRKRTDKQAEKAFADARAAAAKITDPNVKAALVKQVDAAQQQYEAASGAAAAAVRSVQRGVASLGAAVSSLSKAQELQARQAFELADAAVDALTLKAPVAGTVQLGGPGPASGSGSSLSDLLNAAGGATGGTGADPAGGTTSTGSAGVDSAVPQGAFVAAGTPIATVVDVSTLGLTAAVDETDVLLVKTGAAATVELDAAEGATYRAKVKAIDMLPTNSARGGVSYQVRLDLSAGKNADGTTAPTPRPGMSAVIHLQVRQATDAVTVPASAIVNTDGQNAVWAVRNGRYERVPVTLGVQGEDVVQVTDGVQPGQSIAVSGTDQITAGDKP